VILAALLRRSAGSAPALVWYRQGVGGGSMILAALHRRSPGSAPALALHQLSRTKSTTVSFPSSYSIMSGN